MNDAIEKAVRKVIDAYVIEGRAPLYHRNMKAKLKREWKPLADAIEFLIRSSEEMPAHVISGAYRNIEHPAIAAVRCSFCGANSGAPCRKKEANQSGMPYTETHMVRVKAWLAAEKAKVLYGVIIKNMEDDVARLQEDFSDARDGNTIVNGLTRDEIQAKIVFADRLLFKIKRGDFNK